MEIAIIEQAYGVRWQQRAGIWIGIGINPASITLGGGLASRLPLSALVWLMPVGAVILVSLVVMMAIIGRRRRKPLAQLSTGVLGLGLGALLLNLIMGLGMVGWSGFQLGLSGTGVANLLRAPWWLGVGLMAGLFYWFSTLNVNRWNALVWITTLSSLALAVVALITVVGREVVITAAAAPFSLGAALWVLGSVVAYGSLFTLRVSDFSWDMDTDRDVIFDG
ncbi:MAG: hypothetical protein R3264_15010, partial [Anaerolineae bacterium]|nr:hypothetical protein [Anaerolineae bacterium]